MIDSALTLLRDELEHYIQTEVDASIDVTLENIALFEPSQPGNLNGVVMSLVNIEEESALKNSPATRKNGIGGIDYINPPVFLNLYVLICSNPGEDRYRDALHILSGVIRFFQIRNAFTIGTAAASTQTITGDEPEDLLQMKLNVELYTLTFEQINHLWGALGGRQLPFVMYKVRIASVYDRRVLREAPLVETIEQSHKLIQEPC
jgi:Pvc16 N-terminal domain